MLCLSITFFLIGIWIVSFPTMKKPIVKIFIQGFYVQRDGASALLFLGKLSSGGAESWHYYDFPPASVAGQPKWDLADFAFGHSKHSYIILILNPMCAWISWGRVFCNTPGQITGRPQHPESPSC